MRTPASPADTPPALFDRALRRRRLDRAAAGFAEADFLHRRVAWDLADRTAAIMRDFPLGVDLSARRGAYAEALAEAAPGKVALLIEADLSAAMLGGRTGPRLVLDDERLPFAAESLDLIVSGLALHWANDVVGALIQARRALKPGGVFMAALLGGSTLTELRQALTEAEVAAWGGAGSRISPFASAQDGADLLQRAGFADPVCDVDRVKVTYEHPLKLFADLRAMGETNALNERHPRALSRDLIGRVSARYAEAFAEADGRIPATFEILTLTGWVR